MSLTIRSRSHAASEAAKDNVRLFLIFWDESRIGQMVSANRARSYLMQFVRTAFGPTDIVGFMDPLTPIDAYQVHARSARARRARAAGSSDDRASTCRRAASVEDAHLQQGDVEKLRSEVTVSAVQSAAVHLGGIRDGRKSLIVISEGLRGIQRDRPCMTDLIRAANDNNTAIYAVDPRGLGQQRFPSIWESVAATPEETTTVDNLEKAFRQVVVESSGFYLSATRRPTAGSTDVSTRSRFA